MINLAKALVDLGIEVDILCSQCSSELLASLKKKGVNVEVLFPAIDGTSAWGKIKNWLTFGHRVWARVSERSTHLWVATADTAIALGPKLLKHRYILQVLELYEATPLYRQLLPSIARNAMAVVVPEYSRANILRVWWKLDRTPFVLPNVTYDHPRQRELEIPFDKQLQDTLAKIQKPILIYQGLIGPGRDIGKVVKAVAVDGDYHVLLLGRPTGDIEPLLQMYSDVTWVPFVPPPQHLLVTSHAHVGVAKYDHSLLNNVFCAPNKIYEYSGFGIPILCHDIPGLRYTVAVNRAGVCVDCDDPEQIRRGLREIRDNYETYSLSSRSWFDHALRDYVESLRRIIAYSMN